MFKLPKALKKYVQLFHRRRSIASLKKLPWYVILGEARCGKSSFISHSKFSLLSTRKFDNELSSINIGGNQSHLYCSNDAAILELSLTPEIRNTNETTHFLVTISRLIKRFCRSKAISAAIITINLSDFILDFEKLLARQVQFLDEVLLRIAGNSKTQLPIYFLLTQCDRIHGFTEFFSGADMKSLNSVWGISFDDIEPKDNYTEVFKKKYAKFITLLNEQLLLKITQAQDMAGKSAIYCFPLQMQIFAEPILKLTSNYKSHNKIKGIYFISNGQGGDCYDFVTESLARKFNFSRSGGLQKPFSEESCFAKNLFNNIVIQETKPSLINPLFGFFYKISIRHSLILLTLLLIACSCVFISSHYRHSQKLEFVKNNIVIKFNNLPHAIKILEILIAQKEENSFKNKPIIDESVLELARIIKNTESNHEQYSRIIQGLVALRDYLKTINVASNANQAAFQELSNLIAKNSSHNPILQLKQLAIYESRPLGNALDNIADQSLDLLFKDTHRWINSIWQSTIVPIHQKHIQGRFPFKKNSDMQVDISSFETFFGNQGAFIIFFETYLKPFIDIEQNSWRLYQLNGHSLRLSNNTIEQLRKAYLIHTTYFKRDFAGVGIKFFIKPQILDPQSKSVSLRLGNQNLIYRHDPEIASNWQWPPIGDVHHAKVLFSDFHGHNFSQTTNGVWAFFKLLSMAQLERASISGHVIFSLSQGQHRATFEMWSPNNILAFDLEILQSFDLPNSI